MSNRYCYLLASKQVASASVVRMTTLADANRTRMTNTFCVYTVLRYSLMMDSGPVRNM